MTKFLSCFLILFLLGCSSNIQKSEQKKYLEETKDFLQNFDSKKPYLLDSKPFAFEYLECIDAIKYDTLHFTRSEIIEIEKQAKTPKIKNWTKDLLKQATLVNHDTIKNIFADFKNKHWRYFRKNYGSSFNTYSAPIFLRNYTYCLFYFSNSCGGLCGGGSMVLYKKENGEWKSVDKYCMWIS